MLVALIGIINEFSLNFSNVREAFFALNEQIFINLSELTEHIRNSDSQMMGNKLACHHR